MAYQPPVVLNNNYENFNKRTAGPAKNTDLLDLGFSSSPGIKQSKDSATQLKKLNGVSIIPGDVMVSLSRKNDFDEIEEVPRESTSLLKTQPSLTPAQAQL